MNNKFKTFALCEYFRDKPDGEYYPFTVSTDLGLSNANWRRYALTHLYPEGSEARQERAKVGVSIKTLPTPKEIRGSKIFISTFVKETNIQDA